MKTWPFITRWLAATCLLCALALPGCGRKVCSYGAEETLHLEKGQPAPWTGWLLSDADLEYLLKAAEKAGKAQ